MERRESPENNSTLYQGIRVILRVFKLCFWQPSTYGDHKTGTPRVKGLHLGHEPPEILKSKELDVENFKRL